MISEKTKLTKSALEIALLKLLYTKELSNITVLELSKVANLSRHTFYLLYKNKYDLYDQLEGKYCYKIKQYFVDYCLSSGNEITTKSTCDLVDYIWNNKDIFDLLNNSHCNGQFVNNMRDDIIEEIKNESFFENKVMFQRLNIIFKVTGVLGIIEKWIENGFLIMKKDIIRVINKMLKISNLQ